MTAASRVRTLALRYDRRGAYRKWAQSSMGRSNPRLLGGSAGSPAPTLADDELGSRVAFECSSPTPSAGRASPRSSPLCLAGRDVAVAWVVLDARRRPCRFAGRGRCLTGQTRS